MSICDAILQANGAEQLRLAVPLQSPARPIRATPPSVDGDAAVSVYASPALVTSDSMVVKTSSVAAQIRSAVPCGCIGFLVSRLAGGDYSRPASFSLICSAVKG